MASRPVLDTSLVSYRPTCERWPIWAIMPFGGRTCVKLGAKTLRPRDERNACVLGARCRSAEIIRDDACGTVRARGCAEGSHGRRGAASGLVRSGSTLLPGFVYGGDREHRYGCAR